jgi:phage repressor protein C with HTH and peptisase S24 domain
MRHSELVATITKQIGREPNQQELAKILGLTRNGISSRAHRDKEYSYTEVEKIEDYYKINFSNQAFIDDMQDYSGEIIADYYPDVLASCGGGTFELSVIKEKIRVPKLCIKNYIPTSNYSVINAYGDSMQPTIQNGDKLVIEFTTHNEIRDNNIYVFTYHDKIFCKRLIRNIDNIVITSDNPDKSIYPTSTIYREEMNDIHIIGRIAGLMRSM